MYAIAELIDIALSEDFEARKEMLTQTVKHICYQYPLYH